MRRRNVKQKSELDRYLSIMGIPRPYVDLDLYIYIYTYLASIFQAHTATCLVSTVLLAWIQTVQTCYAHLCNSIYTRSTCVTPLEHSIYLYIHFHILHRVDLGFM